MTTDVCVIFNPVAGARQHRAFGATVSKALPGAGSHQFWTTEGPGHAEALARTAAERGTRVVVAAGGDGTVNEVARGLLGSGSALGIVPLGSGNGLARHLGLSMLPSVALARFRTPQFSRIDVGQINGSPFFCTAGIGFDAQVSRAFAASRRRGLASYASLTLQEYRRFKSTRITLACNGATRTSDCFLLTMANASQYGNNAYIAPHADLRDGLLDICLIETLPPFDALRVLAALVSGRPSGSAQVSYDRSSAIEVTATAPIGYHVDGNFVAEADRFDVSLTAMGLEIAT